MAKFMNCCSMEAGRGCCMALWVWATISSLEMVYPLLLLFSLLLLLQCSPVSVVPFPVVGVFRCCCCCFFSCCC